MTDYVASLERFFDTNPQVVCVELSRVRGSSPREAGTRMFVSPTGHVGTIGGGQLEYMAIDEARALLRKGGQNASMDVPLGPEIGQCCGGRVEISLTVLTARQRTAVLEKARQEHEAFPTVLIVGAGHVGRALASILVLLPLRPVLIDSREEELALSDALIEKRLTPLPEADVRGAPKGSAVVILTHEHSLDFLVAAEALARQDLSYIGMIGSKTKRASFEKWCAVNGNPSVDTTKLVCPMGVTHSADKRPEVIATFVAAELMEILTQKDQEMKTVTAVGGEKKRRCQTKHTA